MAISESKKITQSTLNCFSYLALNGIECLDYTYQSFLDMLGNAEYDSNGVGFRQWIYQTCTEFGWYQSSDQPDHPYGSKFPLEFSIKVNDIDKHSKLLISNCCKL